MNKQIFLLLVVALFAACTTESNPIDSSSNEIVKREPNVMTSVILSDPAKDPYSVENMTAALRKTVLAKSRSAKDSAEANQFSLEPNFLYVRFLAEGKRGVFELKQYDTSLVLFKHPLDYKQIEKPVVYKDPALPDSIIPLFATVPVNYKFGPTRYEIIKNLFLVEPDEECNGEDCEKQVRGLAKKMSTKMENLGISLNDVLLNSLKMTGNIDGMNLDEFSTVSWSFLGGGKKYGGQLKFKDEQLGDQPLVGVRVIGGYAYYWRTAYTDSDGKFSIPEKWTMSIDYEANFDTDDFLLEDGHSNYGEDLEIEKNNMKDNWNATFGGDTAMWCIVWTAAYQYWYGERYGLKKPRTNGTMNLSYDIVIYYKNESDYLDDVGCGKSEGCTHTDWFLFGDDRSAILTYGLTQKIVYGNVIHEISHVSQRMNQKSGSFSSLDTNFKETYAMGNNYYFVKERYGKFDYAYVLNGIYYVRYYHNYTGLVEDLIDDNSYTSDYKSYIDKVGGFSIAQIENATFNSKSLPAMKEFLKRNYPSGKNGITYSSQDLNALFNYWIEM